MALLGYRSVIFYYHSHTEIQAKDETICLKNNASEWKVNNHVLYLKEQFHCLNLLACNRG